MNKILILFITLSLLLYACGGGKGGGSSDGTKTIIGTVATGAPIVDASIILKDFNGVSATTTTDSSGKYILTFTDLIPPYIIKSKSARASNSVEYYALVQDHPNNNIINITPITDSLLRTTGKDPRTLFNDAATQLALLSETDFKKMMNAEIRLKSALKNFLKLFGSSMEIKMLHNSFNADKISPMDRLLECLRYDQTNGRLSIKATCLFGCVKEDFMVFDPIGELDNADNSNIPQPNIINLNFLSSNSISLDQFINQLSDAYSGESSTALLTALDNGLSSDFNIDGIDRDQYIINEVSNHQQGIRINLMPGNIINFNGSDRVINMCLTKTTYEHLNIRKEIIGKTFMLNSDDLWQEDTASTTIGNYCIQDRQDSSTTSPRLANKQTNIYKNINDNIALSVTSARVNNKISLGRQHTCGTNKIGQLKCWGNNQYGQLGIGNNIDAISPNNVINIPRCLKEISSGAFHTCALSNIGGVKCWGINDYGQLGDNTITDKNKPVNVFGLSKGVRAISNGTFHTCAITNTGGVKCWGRNNYGQLGDGTTTNRIIPRDVFGLSSVAQSISLGSNHSCALIESGILKCWGDNYYNQISNDDTNIKYTPEYVLGLPNGIQSISSGTKHLCVLTAMGGVKCRGSNDEGQLCREQISLNNDSVDNCNLPNNLQFVGSGDFHICVQNNDNNFKCWGTNTHGQLGDGSKINRNTPVDVIGF